MTELDIGIWNPRVGFADAGGTETVLREMVRRLTDDHGVTVYTHLKDGEVPEALADAVVVDLPARTKEDRAVSALARLTPVLPAEVESLTMYASARVRCTFDRMAHDVLSTHYYLDNLLVSRMAPCPTLFRFAGIKHPSPRWRAMLRYDDTDSYVSNSSSTADRLEKWFGLTVDETVYAGVDADRFHPDRAVATDGGRHHVLYAGRLDEGKGLTDLIRALALTDDDIALRLVGDGVLRDELEELVHVADVEDRVTFAGRVPHDQMPEEYAQADLFVLPSVHEGFPVTVVEALASGTPVIASDIDAIRETVRDGQTGWLVSPGDTMELAGAIEHALSHPERAEEVGQAGREVVREYEWEVQADRMAAAYQEVAHV